MSRPMTREEIEAEQALMAEQAVMVPQPPEISDEEAQKVTPFDLLDSSNYTDRATREARYNICKSCDRLMNLTKQCKECFCFMPAKTWLKDAVCPLGKW